MESEAGATVDTAGPEETPNAGRRTVPEIPAAWRQEVLCLAAGNPVNLGSRNPVIRAAILKAAVALIAATISNEECDQMLTGLSAPAEPAAKPAGRGRPRKAPEGDA